MEQNKKASDIDLTYLELAKKFLYNEYSIALDKTAEETREYFISKLKKTRKLVSFFYFYPLFNFKFKKIIVKFYLECIIIS